MKLVSILLLIITLNFKVNAQDPTFEWAKSVGGNSASANISKKIIADEWGNVYTVGYFSDTSDFDPSATTYNLVCNGDYDGFITKYNSKGEFLWVKQIGGALTDWVYSVTLDNKGYLYATGCFNDEVNFNPKGTNKIDALGKLDIFVLKLDTGGNFIWVKQISGYDDEISFDIKTDRAGDVYIAGYFEDEVDFDPGSGTYKVFTSGYEDIFTLKLSSSGNFVWLKHFAGTKANMSFPYSIALDDSKNIYIAGIFTESVDFDPGKSTQYLTAVSAKDAFICKLDSNGNYSWAHQFGNYGDEKIYGIALDASANVYATGIFEGTVDFNPGSGTANLTAARFDDIFIVKLNSSGNYIWAKRLGGRGTNFVYGIDIDRKGNVYTTGRFDDSSDFDPGSKTYMLISKDGIDVFVSKLNSSGNFVWAAQFGGKVSFSEGSSISVNDSGEVFTTGYFTDTTDFDQTSDTLNLQTKGGWNMFVQKMGQCKDSRFSITAKACSAYKLNSVTYNQSGTFTQTLTNSRGCDSIITLTLTLNNTSSTLNISSCSTYVLNTITYTNSGTYKQTLTNKAGCDSIITLILTLKNTSSTLNISSCNSYVLNTFTYTNSGTYKQTLTNKAGCDSALTLNLIIKKSTSNVISASACKPYLLNGQTYTKSGTYHQTMLNQAGCDSIITINLTIVNLDITVTQSGDTLTANASGAAYQWIDCNNSMAFISGKNQQSFIATKNGKYAVIITQNSCSDTSNCLTVTKLIIDKSYLFNSFVVYPNPSNKVVKIRMQQPLNNGKIQILNSLGKTIEQLNSQYGEEFTLNISLFSEGVYFIVIEQDGIIIRASFIKN